MCPYKCWVHIFIYLKQYLVLVKTFQDRNTFPEWPGIPPGPGGAPQSENLNAELMIWFFLISLCALLFSFGHYLITGNLEWKSAFISVALRETVMQTYIGLLKSLFVLVEFDGNCNIWQLRVPHWLYSSDWTKSSSPWAVSKYKQVACLCCNGDMNLLTSSWVGLLQLPCSWQPTKINWQQPRQHAQTSLASGGEKGWTSWLSRNQAPCGSRQWNVIKTRCVWCSLVSTE